MELRDDAIGTEMQRFLYEESEAAGKNEASIYFDALFIELDEENESLGKFTKHMFAIVSEDSSLSTLAKEVTCRYMLMQTIVIHRADKLTQKMKEEDD